MFKSSEFQSYLGHLFELGKTHTNQIEEESLIDLTAKLIRETPTKYLPILENYDRSRDVICMLSKWMETEDEEVGYEILCKLRDCAISAFESTIDDKLADYAQREEAAQREAAKENAINIYLDNKQRL